tara:strand:+ start:1321 stop:1509 length:189 start_codon:yes stop_codon:yes gene_type:complete
MGKIRREIEKIQRTEKLTLTEVFRKHPHLETLFFLELREEDESAKLEKLPRPENTKKKLLLD